MITRFSSRTQPLDADYLAATLAGARRYDRIAGYFSSSLLEIAGEAVAAVAGPVRIICNSDLHPQDVLTARAAAQAQRREWATKADAQLPLMGQGRFQRLYALLRAGKLVVRVLPNECFGLIHGKAGVVERADGSLTCFMGSVNETLSAWKRNYELLWEDDSAEAVQWVQAEFDALWHHPRATPLVDAIVEDVGRLAQRQVVTLPAWANAPQPAAVVVEAPVYRQEYGLWAHQKYFVDLAFRQHRAGGARLILADMVGLGKTVQLGLAALLATLWSDEPVLIVVPKALLWQWQGELRTLLAVPAAVWDGRRWVDENGYPYPAAGPEQLRRCPRRVGIVSQGLITHGGPAAEFLLEPRYACVIVDEAHRARRRNLRPDGENDPADPNNLLRWLRRVARRATSLLLGTATPVQIQPIEAYDLLEALSQGNDHGFGNELSAWRRDKRYTLALAMGQEPPPAALEDLWDLLRNPLPAAEDNEQVFGTTRRHLDLPAAQAVVPGPRLHELRRADHIRLQREGAALLRQHHPFIRHIVRRTRDYLETTTDPTTGEKYLQPVAVRLFGEDEAGAILLPDYLEDAYRTAEDFCKALAHEKRSAGFLRMLLLKRMGSSIAAGRRTAQALLDSYGATPNPQPPNPLTSSSLDNDSEEDDDTLETEAEEEDATALAGAAALLTQTPGAHQLLIRLIRQLDRYRDRDPKYAKLHQLLTRDGWADRGCIIFSQYYDTAYYLSELLSQDIPAEPIGLYAGGNRSGLWRGGLYEPCGKEDLKRQVQAGQLRILFGTDAASEGLNLQRLSTLINVDLPWNPTRLEQRKGRIQRIGQVHPEIYIYNMRYRGSVEDRIHRLLSERLENLHHLFGQIPDVLEAAWIDVAEGREEDARQRINAVPQRHPFEMKYDRVTPINWESCAQVLSAADQLAALRKGW